MTPDQIKFNHALMHENYSYVRKCMSHNIPPTADIFLNACAQNMNDCVLYCLDYKMIPTRDHFMAVLSKFIRCASEDCHKIIQTFIDIGYNVSYDDFLMLTSKRVELKNFSNYNFVLDEQFINTCIDISFYPSYYDSVESTIDHFIKECKKNNNAIPIIKLIKKGIQPTIECLEIICKQQNNMRVAKYLINECKLKPNLKCVENMVKSHGGTLEFIFNTFLEGHNMVPK